MSALGYSLASTLILSLFSIIGVFFLKVRESFTLKIIFILVALAAGCLMGGTFFHMLPKAAEILGFKLTGVYLLIGFVLFFLLERLIRWRHCHIGVCDIHPVSYLSLIGDSVHNFFDGVIIAGSFLIDIHTGILTSIIIFAHEIPQELGDFGVLVHSGISAKKALLLNFLVSLTSIFGAVLGYFAFAQLDHLLPYILAIASGNFLYIAACDLVPEFHKEKSQKRAFTAFFVFCLALLLMGFLESLLHTH